MLKNNKVLIIFVLVSIVALAFVGCNAKDNSANKGNDAVTAGSFKDGIHQGSAQGFKSEIKVEVEVKNGNIASIKVLENNDTPGFGDKAADGVIDAIIKAQSTKVDVVSGASASSKAVIKAVEIALGLAEAEKPAVEAPKTIAPMTFENGKFVGTAKGFKSEIKLLVEVEDAKIKSIEVLEQGETPGIGDTGIESTIKAVIDAQSTEIDAISGATVSSKAVIEAIKNAFVAGPASAEDLVKKEDTAAAPQQPAQPSQPATQPSQPATQPTQPTTQPSQPAQQPTPQPTQPSQPAQPAKGPYKDGKYTEKAEGFYGDMTTIVEVVIENGNIKAVNVKHEDTAGIADPAIAKIKEAILAKQSANVDTVSGATVTSKNVIEAVKKALEKAK